MLFSAPRTTRGLNIVFTYSPAKHKNAVILPVITSHQNIQSLPTHFKLFKHSFTFPKPTNYIIISSYHHNGFHRRHAVHCSARIHGRSTVHRYARFNWRSAMLCHAWLHGRSAVQRYARLNWRSAVHSHALLDQANEALGSCGLNDLNWKSTQPMDEQIFASFNPLSANEGWNCSC
jgi:hypothetical protein